VNLELAIALGSLAMSALGVVLWFLLRWVLGELIRRIGKTEENLVTVRGEHLETIKALHANDIATERLIGRIALLEQAHGNRDGDVRELRDAIRDGFARVDRRFESIEHTLRNPRSPAPPPSGSTPRMPAAGR